MKTSSEKTSRLAKASSVLAHLRLGAAFPLAAGLALAASAQVNVTFQNRGTGASGQFSWPLYLPEPADVSLEKFGNTATGIPAGTQSYGGAPLSGSGYTAQLWMGLPTSTEEFLTPVAVTGFQSGANAGFLVPVTVSSSLVPPGVSFAWQARVWDNRAGTIMTWSQALADSSILRGKSPVFISPSPLPGISTTADGYSFNLHVEANRRIAWFTIDGGGAFNSAGGTFRVSGSIGQPDAGTLTSRAYGVTGGFWSATLAINPRLRITQAGPNVLLAWPDPSTGFRLEETAALPATPGSWSAVVQTPSVVSDEKQVTLPHSAIRRFYRLARP